MLQRRATLIGVLLGVVAMAVPAAATGQATTVPPGNSEADQYFETVPGPGGDSSTDGSASPGDVLTPKQEASLEAQGADGVAAAELAAETAPQPSPAPQVSPTADPADPADPADRGSSPATAGLSGAAPDHQGLGSWLWVFLVGASLAALAIGAVRWRASRG